MGHIQKILVPVDGSPPSTAALAFATSLAKDTNATVDALHVQAPDTFSSPSAPAAQAQQERQLQAAIGQASARLGERVRQYTESGDPLRTILEKAAAEKYDLVVIGTHGRVGRLHALLGSVAEGVVRNAPCPVLTVREPGPREESFAERVHHIASIGEERSGGEEHAGKHMG